MDFINEIESYLNINAIKDFLPMQDGDVQNTEADTSDLYQMIDFKPRTNIKDGLKNFLDWYEDYYS
jgi:UDP-glucuronate 4-epimerase